MRLKKCPAKESQIVVIGQKIKELQKENGCEYLPLNRGVNQVAPIDLSNIIPTIDFNSPQLQHYPPTQGIQSLRSAINSEFFGGKSTPENVIVTGGGMMALDLAVQSLDIEKLYLPTFYWGCYYHILNLRQVGVAEYSDISLLPSADLSGSGVLICDPGNPLGEKHDDNLLYGVIKSLSDNGIPVIFDSPYRRMFRGAEDDFYARLLEMENVIITESFSKSVGLSGIRLGFVHSTNQDLVAQMTIRLNYSTNGISTFSQTIVERLLTTEDGKKAVAYFKDITSHDIRLNIEYLRKKQLLADEFYTESRPEGLFAVVKLTQDQLMERKVGSVSLAFFTKSQKEMASKYARICISIPHTKLKEYL